MCECSFAPPEPREPRRLALAASWPAPPSEFTCVTIHAPAASIAQALQPYICGGTAAITASITVGVPVPLVALGRPMRPPRRFTPSI